MCFGSQAGLLASSAMPVALDGVSGALSGITALLSQTIVACSSCKTGDISAGDQGDTQHCLQKGSSHMRGCIVYSGGHCVGSVEPGITCRQTKRHEFGHFLACLQARTKKDL